MPGRITMDNPSLPRIAYLVNRYPAVSHTFIRREIRALENLGATVDRYSIRSAEVPQVDAEDEKERQRTRVLLKSGTILASWLPFFEMPS